MKGTHIINATFSIIVKTMNIDSILNEPDKGVTNQMP